MIRADYADSFPIRLAWDLTGESGIDEGTLTEVTMLLAPRDAVDTAEGSETAPTSYGIQRRPPPILVMLSVLPDRVVPANVG